MSALLSLGASFVALVIFDGYMANVKSIYFDQFKHRQMLGDVMIENSNLYSKEGIAEPWKFWVNKAEQDAVFKFIENHKSQVTTVVRSLHFQGMISNGKQSQIFLGHAYDIENGQKMRGKDWQWDTTYGVPLYSSAERFNVIFGQGLGKRMGCTFSYPKDFTTDVGGYQAYERPFTCTSKDTQISTMTPDGQLNAINLNLTGLFDAGYKDVDDRMINTSLQAAQTLLNTEGVTNMTLDLAPGASLDELMDQFNKEVISQFPHLHMIQWKDHRVGDIYVKTIDFLSIFRNFIIVVILVVSTMSVVNTLVKIVKERTREIGTLRSIGFRSRQVAIMFLYESLYLAMIGSFFGLLSSLILTVLLNSMKIMYKAGMLSEPVVFKVDFVPHGYLTAWALLLTVSLLASYFSTLSILKSKIVDNLIHV